MASRYDVVVVGAGNAAFCAAHAARERVERVLVLEKAPREWAGGNSYFTAGAFRTTFESLDDLRPLLDDLSDEQAARTEPLLRADEYRAPGVSRVEAASVRELAEALGLDSQALERTVDAYNAAVQPGAFNPAIKDGKHTRGLDPPKSNWARPLDMPPFYGFAVTCGITFTFGGVRIDGQARVLDGARPTAPAAPIPALYAAGELVGGLFYHNYPGGSGLTAGAVFGRRAGLAAAEYVRAGRGGRHDG